MSAEPRATISVATGTGDVHGMLPNGETLVLLPGNGPVDVISIVSARSIIVTLQTGESVRVDVNAESGLVESLVTLNVPDLCESN